MATYAAGNIINGKLGDTFNPTTILAIGLFGSGACLFLINLAIWFDFKGINSTFGDVFILAVYFLFGLFQATGGPVGTAVRIVHLTFLSHTTTIFVGWWLLGHGKLVR
jgi:MFS transporter, OPA family, solute carrier family 37 (glycerol-3-phosphate transporter), member 1/2